METGIHIIVRGVVQGVGFRYYVLNTAVQLGLRGFTRNLQDGTVEIEACGDRSLLEEFVAAVKIGPRSAQVTDVIIEWIKSDIRYKRFEVR